MYRLGFIHYNRGPGSWFIVHHTTLGFRWNTNHSQRCYGCISYSITFAESVQWFPCNVHQSYKISAVTSISQHMNNQRYIGGHCIIWTKKSSLAWLSHMKNPFLKSMSIPCVFRHLKTVIVYAYESLKSETSNIVRVSRASSDINKTFTLISCVEIKVILCVVYNTQTICIIFYQSDAGIVVGLISCSCNLSPWCNS